jgi:hypothetical protein
MDRALGLDSRPFLDDRPAQWTSVPQVRHRLGSGERSMSFAVPCTCPHAGLGNIPGLAPAARGCCSLGIMRPLSADRLHVSPTSRTLSTGWRSCVVCLHPSTHCPPCQGRASLTPYLAGECKPKEYSPWENLIKRPKQNTCLLGYAIAAEGRWGEQV